MQNQATSPQLQANVARVERLPGSFPVSVFFNVAMIFAPTLNSGMFGMLQNYVSCR
jgi:hypothetical protein